MTDRSIGVDKIIAGKFGIPSTSAQVLELIGTQILGTVDANDIRNIADPAVCKKYVLLLESRIATEMARTQMFVIDKTVPVEGQETVLYRYSESQQPLCNSFAFFITRILQLIYLSMCHMTSDSNVAIDVSGAAMFGDSGKAVGVPSGPLTSKADIAAFLEANKTKVSRVSDAADILFNLSIKGQAHADSDDPRIMLESGSDSKYWYDARQNKIGFTKDGKNYYFDYTVSFTKDRKDGGGGESEPLILLTNSNFSGNIQWFPSDADFVRTQKRQSGGADDDRGRGGRDGDRRDGDRRDGDRRDGDRRDGDRRDGDRGRGDRRDGDKGRPQDKGKGGKYERESRDAVFSRVIESILKKRSSGEKGISEDDTSKIFGSGKKAEGATTAVSIVFSNPVFILQNALLTSKFTETGYSYSVGDLPKTFQVIKPWMKRFLEISYGDTFVGGAKDGKSYSITKNRMNWNFVQRPSPTLAMIYQQTVVNFDTQYKHIETLVGVKSGTDITRAIRAGSAKWAEYYKQYIELTEMQTDMAKFAKALLLDGALELPALVVMVEEAGRRTFRVNPMMIAIGAPKLEKAYAGFREKLVKHYERALTILATAGVLLRDIISEMPSATVGGRRRHTIKRKKNRGLLGPLLGGRASRKKSFRK